MKYNLYSWPQIVRSLFRDIGQTPQTSHEVHRCDGPIPLKKKMKYNLYSWPQIVRSLFRDISQTPQTSHEVHRCNGLRGGEVDQ